MLRLKRRIMRHSTRHCVQRLSPGDSLTQQMSLNSTTINIAEWECYVCKPINHARCRIFVLWYNHRLTSLWRCAGGSATNPFSECQADVRNSTRNAPNHSVLRPAFFRCADARLDRSPLSPFSPADDRPDVAVYRNGHHRCHYSRQRGLSRVWRC